jgi:uncharacterized iron-regulated membrane protein
MRIDLYRAVWRWHFYAGLFVLPFLAWLAVTGGLYLFKPEIERAWYDGWITLDAQRNAIDATVMIERVETSRAAAVTQVERPADPAHSWRMRADTVDGPRTLFVDPGDGAVLGTTREGGIMKLDRDLHGLAITGPIGNALIEIAAGWTIILCLTGFYLWWPRNGFPALALRRPTARRRFWRDLHASTGAFAGLVILFLALTGMPWSLFWGKQVQRSVAEAGLGRPRSPAPAPWEHAGGHAERARKDSLPWALQEAPMPAGHGHGAIGPGQALAIADRAGLGRAVTLTLPQEPGQPFTAARTVVRADDARAIYIDAADGRVVQDAAYASFGAGAQVIEWGIATHQGQQYGESNRWVMLAGCIAVMLLVVSAPVMWWKRRVDGSLRRPPMPARRTLRVVGIGMVGLGVLLPLTGLSMLLVAAAEWFAGRVRRTA